MSSVLPALVLLFAAGIILLLPARIRPAAQIAAFALVLAQLVFGLELGTTRTIEWLSLELTPLRVDGLSLAFGTVFSIIGTLGSIYAYHMRDAGQRSAAMAYGGGALGVVFAGDLFTLIVFWELMAIASAYLVLRGGRPNSRAAGFRYLFVHVVGGTVLLAGVIWHVADTGSITFDAFSDGTIAAWLILAGFWINAAIPPLHAWLADAYPEASVSGIVFLSAFTTKTAVYVLLRGFPGWEILIFFGVLMALYGVVFAVLENDIRRLLAYHIISQVGFMVTAAGIGTLEAVEGGTAHAFAHVLYKGLMMMATGAVLYATGRSKMTELGDLAWRMKAVLTLYMIGAFSISAVPLFAGFVSKSLITDAAYHDYHPIASYGLYVASVGTFLHTGLKLPYFTWFGKKRSNPVPIVNKIPLSMYIGMGGAALLCVVIGLFPQTFYSFLNFQEHHDVVKDYKIVHTLELLVFTGLGFWLLIDVLKPKDKVSLDTDVVYRRAANPVRIFIQQPLEVPFTYAARQMDKLVEFSRRLAVTPQQTTAKLMSLWGDPDAVAGLIARPPLGVAVVAVFVVFSVILLVAGAIR